MVIYLQKGPWYVNAFFYPVEPVLWMLERFAPDGRL